MNAILVNIGCGIAGGLVVLGVQETIAYFRKQREERQTLTVGNPKLKILDSDFLHKYEPGKISIDKIIQEFGQANRIETSTESIGEIAAYFYILENAKVIFNSLLLFFFFIGIQILHEVGHRITASVYDVS